ncbi:MAG: flagellar filament capping protein FliD [Candidatus Riflebacteria bacterium]|nr:flagellar filament capping protein FliD [Candidatus Riflebacteria bacterium]
MKTMVSSVTRNWIGGLSSGLDTQGIIDKFMAIERVPVDRLGQQRDTLTMQKGLLQEVNLKLFDVQNKATDMTFARTFNSKLVTSSNEKVVSAIGNTDAKVGSYSLWVRQLATATKAVTTQKMARPLQLGHNLASTKTIGGSSLTLGALGITPGDLTVSVAGGSTETLTLGLGANSTISDLVSSANARIAASPTLSGKLRASYNESNNQLQFTLTDTTKTMTVSDSGGTIVNKMFDATGNFTVNRALSTKGATIALHSGLSTTLSDLSIVPGKITLQRGGGAVENLDTNGLAPTATVSDLIANLNHQIDSKASLVKSVTGNPADRLVEFRYDGSTRKIQLVGTNSTDPIGFTLADDPADPTSNLTQTLFGGASKNTVNDVGSVLANETFSTPASSGIFTIDGAQISIDVQSDKISDVLTRITNSTSINATYDSARDTIKLTRKDGSNSPIGLGSPGDTSNFLSVTALISGSQGAAAVKESSGSIGAVSLASAQTTQLSSLGAAGLNTPVPAGGSLRITVNGQANTISYNATDTLDSVLDQVKNISGIGQAYYDASTNKVHIETSLKGADKSLKIEDIGGNLAAALNISTDTAQGAQTGSMLESSRPISDISTAKSLATAGFSTAITTGSFTINGVSFTIGNTNSMTLDSLMTTINNNTKVGVKAEFDSLNGQLLLTSKTTGNTTISLGSSTDSSNFLSATGLVTTPQQVGQNAIFNIDGMFGGADIVRQSNTVADVVNGVTFSLKGVTGTTSEEVTVAADTTTSRKAVDDFIKSYNDAAGLIYTRLTEKRDYTLEALTDTKKSSMTQADIDAANTDYKVGLVSGDSTLSSARSQMRVAMSGTVSGLGNSTIRSLADIGITTGLVGSGYQDTQQGLLKVTNEDKLTAALRDNPDIVAQLFGKDGGTDATNGIARRLKDTLNQYTKSDGLLTQRVGRSGSDTSNSSMDQQIKMVNDQITQQNASLADKENAMIQEYSNLETAMSQYQSQSSAFSQQLAKVTGSSGG